jgi:hypothetical protein
VKGDAAQAAKTIFRLGSEWELLDYKGGLMDGQSLDPDSFKAIARLPGREQLNAQFAGIVASPLTGLVRGLGSMIQGLALQLGQIAEQGLVSGESPAAQESEPDPEPAESPEESSEEEAPEGEEAGQSEAEETTEGDADLGEEAPEENSDEASEDSENKEESE